MKCILTFPWLHRLVLVLACLGAGSAHAADRPNFLWILSEDNSKHFMKLFDGGGAATPNIVRLAEDGLVFEHAFSCSPVCSVARTTLMSGLYAPRMGTQFHRKIEPVQLPEGWQMFPAYLREAGYYTSNNSKTDYNTRNNEGVWDESSKKAGWRRRPAPETPFFHMQTFPVTHESSLHFNRNTYGTETTETNPEDVRLADYHPDTPLFRHTYARYHDRMRMMDEEVGRLVDQLTKDGLLEDTFIFYFGDHGGVLPGSKGYLRETGLHVPLVVRVPKKWEHLVEADRGGKVSGFVNFVDFGPTVLHLAGVKVPGHLDGHPFLGQGISLREVNGRQEAFAYADRFDEKYEMVRSLRRGRYKYVRHFQGYYPDGLQNNYRYNMLAYQEWRDLFRQGKLNGAQEQFFRPKPAEALYDVEADPYEVRNLAQNPDYQSPLRDLRRRLNQQLKELPDLSFYPENILVKEAVSDPIGFGKTKRKEIAGLLEVANLALQPWSKAEPKIRKAMKDDDSGTRYWAMTVCSQFGEQAGSVADQARGLLQDEDEMVRIRAAEFLGGIGAEDPRPALMEVLAATDSPVVSLLALQTVVYLRDGPRAWTFDINPEGVKSKNSEVDRRLKYLAE